MWGGTAWGSAPWSAELPDDGIETAIGTSDGTSTAAAVGLSTAVADGTAAATSTATAVGSSVAESSGATSYPQSAAAMATAVGYGTWTAGWLFEEASGNAVAAFGSPTLTANGSHTYQVAGPYGDLATQSATTADWNGGDVHDIGATDDLLIAMVVRFPGANPAGISIISKGDYSGSSPAGVYWALRHNSGASTAFLTLHDGVDALNVDFNILPSNQWQFIFVALDRANNLARVAVWGVTSGLQTTPASTDISAIGGMGNDGALLIGNEATNAGAEMDIDALYIGVGNGYATGVPAAIDTAIANLYYAVVGGGTSTATAAGEAIYVSSGSAAGTSTASAVGLSTAESSGTPAGTSTAAGVGESTAVSSGTSAGAATATGVGLSTAETAGSTAGTSTASAVGVAITESTGSTAGTSTASAVGETVTESVGTSTASSTASAAGSAVAESAGTSAATATAAGVGASTAESAGTSAGTSTASAVGLSTAESSGTSAGTSTATAVGVAIVESTGTAAGASTAVGVSETPGVDPSIGTAAGTSTAAAVGSSVAESSGTSAGTSTARARGGTASNNANAWILRRLAERSDNEPRARSDDAMWWKPR